MDKSQVLQSVFEVHKVDASVIEVVKGPSITQYQVRPGYGVRIKQITALENDIALAMAARDIRIEAPIPGKSAIGIEIPNEKTELVSLVDLLSNQQTSPLVFPIGKDVYGEPVYGDLAKMPHLLVAGSTGSGKSVCINGLISSIVSKTTKEQVRFVMIDPKKVELTPFNGIPHLLMPVVTDSAQAVKVLASCVAEMARRYKVFAKHKVRNIIGYNSLPDVEPIPYIVMIVDELADLMLVAGKEIEEHIARITQLARAAGMHLVVATQRPSVKVITGVIKANIPTRIAFSVASGIDSRVIIDVIGAEKLLGAGDMLYLAPGMPKPIRVQGAFVSDNEMNTLIGKGEGIPA
ncbi:DNA translocase FtsK [compost metagenome]